MIWANKRLICKKIPILRLDITAIDIEITGRSFLIVSIYIPCGTNQKEKDKESLTTRLSLIHKVIIEETSENPDNEFVLTGDFNQGDAHLRDDRLISHTQQGEGKKLIEFMAGFNIVQLLRHGTPIYHSPSGESSTIDSIFTGDRLVQIQLGCKFCNTHHASDHKAVETELYITTPDTVIPPRLFLKNAPWTKIQEDIQENLNAGMLHAFLLDLDRYTAQLLDLISISLKGFMPKASPNSYYKRCWNGNLSTLKAELSNLRNWA